MLRLPMTTHRAKVEAAIMARNCLHESVVALDANMSEYHGQVGEQEQYRVAKCEPMFGPPANVKPSSASGSESLKTTGKEGEGNLRKYLNENLPADQHSDLQR